MINRNINDYAVSISYYLISGDLLISKQIPESNLYKLLYGLAYILYEGGEMQRAASDQAS